MAPFSEWKVPEAARPRPEDYGYDLDQALAAVVGLKAQVPPDALTADSLGTERAGNGVLIRKTGLVQALARLDAPALPLGDSASASVGQRVIVAGAGGREHAIAARIAAKQEFAGYWEYALDEALFTAPAHPHWGGAALIGHEGELLGIGSLQLEQARGSGKSEHLNMIVPIDLLKPILDDLLSYGRPNRPPRPWLGLFATEVEDKVVVVGLANRGPAEKADLRTGDVVLAVGDNEVSDLAGLFHGIWSLGPAGVEVPLLIYREGRTFRLKVPSADRTGLFKAPRLQ
jgi:S1-C subfamily serine protease